MMNLNLFSKTLFFSSLITGIMISITASDFLMIWVGLEINLISFLPLMMESNSSLSSSNIMKYFLIQTISSFFILFFMIISSMNLNFLINSNCILVAMMVKMGLPPYHFWLPSIMQSLSWNNCFIISSFQKVIPIMIVGTMNSMSKLFLVLILFSMMVSAAGGFLQSQFRPLMAYSSMNHTIWAVMGILFDFYLFMMYFLPYCFSIFILFNFLNKSFSSNFFNSNKYKSSKYFVFTVIIILSIAGLPPLLGFFPKMFILMNIISASIFISVFMLLASAINLFYYLNFSFSFLIFNQPYFNLIYKSSLLLPLFSMLVFLTPLLIF